MLSLAFVAILPAAQRNLTSVGFSALLVLGLALESWLSSDKSRTAWHALSLASAVALTVGREIALAEKKRV